VLGHPLVDAACGIARQIPFAQRLPTRGLIH
jgi:hypothetical protein